MAKWLREFKVGLSIGVSGFAFEIRHSDSRGGCSSVGRAVALQAIGQEFESPQLHQTAWERQSVERAAVRDMPRSTGTNAPMRRRGSGRVAQLVRACA